MHQHSASSTTMASVTKEDKDFYDENGYMVVKNFFTPDEVSLLKEDIKQLIQDNHEADANKTVLQKKQRLLDSASKATLFYEENAFDSEGNLNKDIPLERSVHRIQAGCHLYAEETKKALFSDKMKSFVKDITGFKDPRVIQSMYLLKQPNIGAPKDPHQDEMYLTTDPTGMVFGIWVALDDATEENGCLDFIPGSHKTIPCTRFFVRTGKKEEDGEKVADWEGEAEYLNNHDDSKYVRCPVKSGDLILIHGLVVHKSEANRSDKPRRVFSFHAYESDGGNVKWSNKSWCQESQDYKFMSLYETSV